MSTPDASASQQLEDLLRRLEAPAIATPRDIFISDASERPGYYLRIGSVLGTMTGIAMFIGAYIYCIAAYGFIFGFGLGWIPSGIVAIIVSQVVRFLWGPITLMIALIVVYIARANFQ